MTPEPLLDGITAPPTPTTVSPAPAQSVPVRIDPPVSPELRKRMRFALVTLVGAPYGVFLLWCLILITIFPNASGGFDAIIPLAITTGALGAFIAIAIGAVAGIRIAAVPTTPVIKVFSGIRLAAVVLPGVILGGWAALAASSEPSLPLRITAPTDAKQVVAPLAVTFSAEEAMEIVAKRNKSGVSFAWDFDGDGVANDTTVLPVATAVYDKAGVYAVSVIVKLSDGTTRTLKRQLSIPRQVFSVTPLQPLVDQPLTFDLTNLIATPEDIRGVQWDYESDGKIDHEGPEAQVSTTYVRTGDVTVTAVVTLNNQTKQELKRTITISEPLPQPFAAEIVSEPLMLVSPTPFQTKFSVSTEENVKDVTWDFGDGGKAEGREVGHTFEKKGQFLVTARLRSADTGETTVVSKVVKATDLLKIPNLQFNGEPKVDEQRGMISGEVPLTLKLTPVADPLIDFSWEVPEASEVGSTVTALQAIYRRPGTYSLYLVAQAPDGKSFRRKYVVEVRPPSSFVVIRTDREGGDAPFAVTFDASETIIPGETISGFEWLFGQGKEEKPVQAGAIVRHTFAKPGTYMVTATAKTTKGGAYQSTKTIVVRAPLLKACVTASRTEGAVPLGVKFDSTCTAGTPVSYEWDFGDEAKTDEENPTHVFASSGSFTVTLKVTDSAGTLSTDSLTVTAK